MSITLASTRKVVNGEQERGKEKNVRGGLWLALLWGALVSVQIVVAGVISAVFWKTGWRHFEPLYGMLSAHGFAQGPVQALSMAKTWISSINGTGLQDAVQVGLFFAMLGYLIALLVGVPICNYFFKKNLAALPKSESDNSLENGIYARDTEIVLGKQTTHRANIEAQYDALFHDVCMDNFGCKSCDIYNEKGKYRLSGRYRSAELYYKLLHRYCVDSVHDERNRKSDFEVYDSSSCSRILDAYEQALQKAGGLANNKLRPVMIHSQLVRHDQLERFQKLDMIPSFFVDHVYFWGDTHLKNLGEKRAENISPVAWAKEYRLTYTFHQDTPVLLPNMLKTLHTAVERKTRNGIVLGKNHRITMYEALEAITKNAAYQYGEEDKKGSIEEEKYADFVILDKNPLCTAVDEIERIQVVKTIYRDEILYERE